MESKLSYAAYVRTLVPRYPSLTVLAEYLDNRPRTTSKTSISTLSILKNGVVDALSSNDVDDVIFHLKSHSLESQKTAVGLTILLEDPSAIYMERLGVALDINPLFFAGHIATFYEPIEKRPLPPVRCMHPSQVATQNFMHLHSQRVLDLGDSRQAHGCFAHKLIMPGNIPRNVRQTQSLSGRLIGILRACTSILFKEFHDRKWVCKQKDSSQTIIQDYTNFKLR
jgi:hypothetical protein